MWFWISRLTRLSLILCNFSSPFISIYPKSLPIHWKVWFDFRTIPILIKTHFPSLQKSDFHSYEKCRCDKLSNHFVLPVVLITLAQEV